MTVDGLGGVLGGLLLTGLLCTAPLAAEQREGAHSPKAESSSETAKESSKSEDEASSKGTKRTPFGRSKASSQSKPKDPPPATTPFMEVEEKGDNVVFKRKTPFGIQAWTKKRSELTPEEQEMLRAQQDKKAETPAGGSGAPVAKTAPAAR